MPDKNYTCLRRFMNICGNGCAEGIENARCPTYYPCRVVGVEAITYSNERAKEIQSMLLKKIDVVESFTK